MTREVFCGGEISPNHIGEETVVVTLEHDGDDQYAVFQYLPGSGEFNYITGPRSVANPVERIYMEISREAADLVSGDQLNDSRKTIDTIDDELIVPDLLNQRREMRREEIDRAITSLSTNVVDGG